MDTEVMSGLWDKYVIALYFVNTVLSTIGFGDIAAVNTGVSMSVLVLVLVPEPCACACSRHQPSR